MQKKSGLITRNGELSSKKFFFCVACVTATAVLIWVTAKQHLEYGMEDMWFVVLYFAYLACVGGFEVVPKMMAMLIEFKNGGKTNVAGTIEDTVDIVEQQKDNS